MWSKSRRAEDKENLFFFFFFFFFFLVVLFYVAGFEVKQSDLHLFRSAAKLLATKKI